MKPVDAYYILRGAERDLESMAPDLEMIGWAERFENPELLTK